MKKGLKIIILVFIGIILLIVIDFVCIFTINRPLLAIKDNNQVYRGLFYDTYNCHEYSIPQIRVKGTKLTCTVLDIQLAKESLYKPINIENITISISNVSKTGATIIIKDTNKIPYTYGQWYKIEKNINGKWYELKTIIDNYGFTSIGYLPDKNNEVKFVIDWEWLYGKLPLGNYRILKQVNEHYIAFEFSLI